MNTLNKNLALFVVGIVLLALGAAGGWWWSKRAAMAAPSAMGEQKNAAMQEQSKVLFWYDPMYPQQRFENP